MERLPWILLTIPSPRSSTKRGRSGEVRRSLVQNAAKTTARDSTRMRKRVKGDGRVVKRSGDDSVLEGGHLSSLGLQNSEQEEFLSCKI